MAAVATPVPVHRADRLTQLVDVMSAYNGVDADLDALDVSDTDRARIDALRNSLHATRDRFARLHLRTRGDERGATTRAPSAEAQFTAQTAAAAAVGAPACGGDAMAAAVYRDHAAKIDARAAAVTPTGDFTRDATRICRRRADNLRLPAQLAGGGRSQARALVIRQGLQQLADELAALEATPSQAAAVARVRAIVDDDADVLSAYAESFGISDGNAVMELSAHHRQLMRQMTRALAEVGVDCPAP